MSNSRYGLQQCTSISEARSANTLWRSSDVDVDDGVRFYRYLRFYPDGTVIGVTSSGTPTDLKRWFNKPYESTGTYSFVGSRIKFSLTSPSGTVDYDGRIVRQVLTLHVHSHINSLLKYAPVQMPATAKEVVKGPGNRTNTEIPF
jgi:hypothetical protein